MKRKQIRRMLANAFKTAGADKIIGVYLIWFLVVSLVIWFVEPNVKTFGDGMWLCFASATSIGYGDYAAVTAVGRIAIVLLSLYSIAVIAIVTAVITSFFTDTIRFRADESVRKFMDDLEHLPELSKEELEDLSKRVKNFQNGKK